MPSVAEIDAFLDAEDEPARAPDEIDAFLDAPDEAERPGAREMFGAAMARPAELVTDYFTPEAREGDAEVTPGRAAVVSAQRTLIPGGRSLWEKAFDPASAALNQPADTPRAEFDANLQQLVDSPTLEERRAAAEDEARRAYAQHPELYLATGAASMVAPDPLGALGVGERALRAPLGAVARPAADAAERVAIGQSRRAIGYTPGLVRKHGREQADAAAKRALDDKIVKLTSSPDSMLETTTRAIDDVGARLDSAREYLDQAGDGVTVQELAHRLYGIPLGQPGTRGFEKLDQELLAIIRDAERYARPDGVIPATALQRLKKQLSGEIERRGQAAAADVEGVAGLTESARREVRQLEDELFDASAPGAVADKRKQAELENVREALEGLANRESVRSTSRTGMLDTTAAGAGGVIGGAEGALTGVMLLRVLRGTDPQMRAVAARATARILRSRFAPLFQRASAKGPAAMAVLHAGLSRNPEYQSLLEENSTPAGEPAPRELDLARSELSDERAKERIRPLDSKVVLNRLEQLRAERQAPAKPSAAAAPPSAPPRAQLSDLVAPDGPAPPRPKRVRLRVTKRDENGDILEMEREEF